jgi:hypothetical protein
MYLIGNQGSYSIFSSLIFLASRKKILILIELLAEWNLYLISGTGRRSLLGRYDY